MNEPAIIDRYLRLRESPEILRLLSSGGELHIASEHRPIADILTLMGQGHAHFAEKYCQEMVSKWADPRLRVSSAFLSYFGALQSNKMRRIVGISDSIEGVASLRAASRLRMLETQAGCTRRFLLQVNISREPQKNGCLPEQAGRLLHEIRSETGLRIQGVMIIPKRDADPTPAFRWARAFADAHRLQHCAMGMSGDYRLAVGLGATILRIGRLVWGDAATPRGAHGPDSLS